MNGVPPCVVFEDEHLLVVHKPPGLNTHKPDPFAGDGLYDWLRDREPRWAGLSILHRLDKETSGLIVFGKTRVANVSLSAQFESRAIKKTYHGLTRQKPRSPQFSVRTRLTRDGARYRSAETGNLAVTHFSLSGPHALGWLVEVRPETGRTHQIRAHAAEHAIPLLGDKLYGGAPFPRLCLHATRLEFLHPVSGEHLQFDAKADFESPGWSLLRQAILDPRETDAFRLLHGEPIRHDSPLPPAPTNPDIERYGHWLLALGEQDPGEHELNALQQIQTQTATRGVYFKKLDRKLRTSRPEAHSTRLVLGEPADAPVIRENGLSFSVSFQEGYSVGLFLDQRDNRRRLARNWIAADFPVWHSEHREPQVLNTFAYTCAFSVAAASAGAVTTSLDLSKKYLDWGRKNFELNRLDSARHDFVFGDTFDWLRRWTRKQRKFHVILLDPPTFSQSRQSGVFRVASDFHRLVDSALPLLAPGGVMLASTNSASLRPDEFLAQIRAPIERARRKILRSHYVPQPIDFPISQSRPAYLKTCWLQIEG